MSRMRPYVISIMRHNKLFSDVTEICVIIYPDNLSKFGGRVCFGFGGKWFDFIHKGKKSVQFLQIPKNFDRCFMLDYSTGFTEY